jgi:type IV secretion system protein TrbH
MRKSASFTLLLAWVSGCAINPPQPQGIYGNFVPAETATYQQQFAADAIRQLEQLYPPASTRFDLRQPAPDPFGISLTGSLRGMGYALMEMKAPAAASNGAPSPAVSGGGVPLSYIVDAVSTGGMFRVALFIGNQSLTRAYLVRDGAAHPAGAWVRKESQ